MRPVGVEHAYDPGVGDGDPDRSVDGHLQAIGCSVAAEGREGAPRSERAVRVDIVDAHDIGPCIGVVQEAPVGREGNAVAEQDAIGDGMDRAVEIDPVQEARRRRVAAEDPECQRSDIHAAHRIDRQVVEAGRAGQLRQRQNRGGLAVGDPDDGDVAPAQDQSVCAVHRHPADAAPLGNDRRDIARPVEQVDAAGGRIAEIEARARIPDRSLDQSKSRRQAFHVERPSVFHSSPRRSSRRMWERRASSRSTRPPTPIARMRPWCRVGRSMAIRPKPGMMLREKT